MRLFFFGYGVWVEKTFDLNFDSVWHRKKGVKQAVY